MSKISSAALITMTVILILPSLVGAVATTDHGVVMLGEYFDLLVSGNHESALYLWTQEDLDRSSRFEIEFEGIPLKVDCSSPIVRDLKVMRDYLQPPVKTIAELDSQYTRLVYSQLVGGELVEHYYYSYYDGQYYWLTHPQSYYCQGWPIIETKYLRIHADPGAFEQPNEISIAEADTFIEALADSLSLSAGDMKKLREKKIEYFLCSSDSLVGDIVGTLTKGTLDLATNDVITAFFPHYHELAHLLINIKLRRQPLYVQPLLREGVAVYLGGRWGKSPASLMDLAHFLYKEQIVDLDSLLTMRDFDANSATDIAYPVAGLFCAYLIEQIGIEDFFDLYRSLSGNFQTVYQMTRADVKRATQEALDMPDWTAVLDGFRQYQEEARLRQSPVFPGTIADGDEILRGVGYVVRGDDDWLAFEFERPAGQSVTGNLLFDSEESLQSANSELFAKQYSDKGAFEGYRYGIRYDQNEVGLYDYATGLLLAKYIWGITPSDDYFDEAQNRVTMKFRRALFDKNHLKADLIKLLDY